MPLEWLIQSPPVERWTAVAWSPTRNLFVAVMDGQASDGKHAMTSPDGITWTKRDLPNELISNSWVSIAWSEESQVFFGGGGGFGASTTIFTSTNGITWSLKSVPIGTVHGLRGAACSPTHLIVMGTVGSSGVGFWSTNGGSGWTQLNLSANNCQWSGVCYSPELARFAAVARGSIVETGTRVTTSDNGTTWTLRSSPDQTWNAVAWSPALSLFAAVSQDGTQRVMTSPDGLTWTLRDTPTPAKTWVAIQWSPGWDLFVATSTEGYVMVSADGITWAFGSDPPTLNSWQSLAWSSSLRIFASVALGGTGRVMISTPSPIPPDPRHWGDQLMLSLFEQESPYNTSPAFSESTACSMHGFDDQAAHEEWDDTVDDDEATVHGHEYPTVQVIIRQSVRWNYREPRVVPNTLAGLMGLGLGHITSDQDEALAAYRHRLRPVTSVGLPSISAQTRHAGGRQYRYTGIKSDGFTLAASGAYLSFACPLIGSGARELAEVEFPSLISEPWLKWGDAQVFLVNASDALTLPSDPAQGATNLGGSAINLSSRIRQWSLTHGNALAADAGYRPSTGLYRGAFHPIRRGTTISLEVECQDNAETLLLGHYLSQTPLALELNLDTGLVIAEDGAYRYGLVLIVPRLRLRRVQRQEADQFDTLALEGRVQCDGTNPVLQAWVFNAQAAYLA